MTVRAIAHALGLTNEARFARAVHDDRRAHPRLYQFADEVLSAFHAKGGLAGLGPVQHYKLVSLHRLLAQVKPVTILEIGSGSSSVIFAKYAKERGATFTSVDESEAWVANTREMLSRFGVAEAAELLVRPRRIDRAACEACYEGMPRVEADMVMIDGPSLELDGERLTAAVCVDIFSLPPPKWIVVDMRRPTVERIARQLAQEYRQFPSDVLERRPARGFRYFSVFEKLGVRDDAG